MKRELIIKKALLKLSFSEKQQMDNLVNLVEKLYEKHKKTPYNDVDFSKDIVKLLQDYVTESIFKQKEVLYLFNELKKRNLFDWGLNKHLEKAWRFIFRKWGLPNLNFS